MNPQRVYGPAHGRASQLGQAMIFVALLLLLGVSAVIYTTASSTSVSIANRQADNTARTLAQVKEALIGWSAARTSTGALPNARPGELHCPDNDNDGFEDGSCVAGAVGRVPWKTLGIPEPKDNAGETLWYAIAGPFRIWSMSSAAINSDTKGNITVYLDSTATTITIEAVAVIFSPGAAIGTQDRICTVGVNCTATGQCTTSPASLTPKCNPANYLETAVGVNNAMTNGPFISAQPSDTFNDRLLVITTTDLMPPVEQRVAREMLTLLQSYRAASGCACYPWAANNFDDDSVTGTTRGGVPIKDALPQTWGTGGILPVPSWINNNEWGKVFYYAVAPSQTATASAGTLTVDGASKDLVLITTGPAGASRPSLNLPDYMDDAENSDNDDIFQTPSSTAYARDRLYTCLALGVCLP